MVLKHFRARYSKGVLEPLEASSTSRRVPRCRCPIEATWRRSPSPKHDPKAMRAGAATGGWAGQHDPEELKRMIYESRITGSRGAAGLVANGQSAGEAIMVLKHFRARYLEGRPRTPRGDRP